MIVMGAVVSFALSYIFLPWGQKRLPLYRRRILPGVESEARLRASCAAEYSIQTGANVKAVRGKSGEEVEQVRPQR